MRNIGYFKGKKITVVGLARSGLACANLLSSLGSEVSVTDNQDNELTRLNAAKLLKNIRIELGVHSEQSVRGRDLVVISPGVPNEALPVKLAGKLNIPLISEIEVASILSCATLIAITGSAGKTTVTTLIGKLLEAAGRNVFVCGNIGKPFCGEIEKIKETDFVCLEVSSFQLEGISTFKPKIAAILNFAPNHLDRHKSLQEYLTAKKRIFMNQDKDDYLVLNALDPALKQLGSKARAKLVYFSEEKALNSNQAAVLAIASILGIEKELSLSVFKAFKGIEHRFEYVAEIRNIKFINDSKATTADSTSWALKNIGEPVVLIAGGRDKGVDYRSILEEARHKVKEVILIGEAKDKIRQAIGAALAVDEAVSLEEAVNKAFSKASSGDCVLLSPMCSSFDMFSDYEERGRAFKKAVYGLR